MIRNFSVVVPVKDEVDKLTHNLISLNKLNPSEIIICTDDPTPRKVLRLIEKMSPRLEIGKRIRVMPVSRNKKYLYLKCFYLISKLSKSSTTLTFLKFFFASFKI